jgi:GlcNAc-P-P-Und epimerase
MKKILLIGGSGFVGSALLKTVEITKFINLDKNQSSFFPKITSIGDIRNFDNIKTHFTDVNCVILLAAEHRDDTYPISLYYDVNVEGTKNVLRAMNEAGVKKLIFTSSVAIYGLNKINPDENHIPDPFNHYGKSKWKAEQIIKEWYDNDSLKKSVTIIRPTVIFGERNRGNVYNFFKQIASSKFLMIGKGVNKKSMAYVGNVVFFIKNRIDNNKTGFNIFNFADKPDFSMNELVSLIEKKLKTPISKLRLPFFLGMLVGYGFDFFAFLIRKKLRVSSVRVKKFCATTQFDSTKVHSIFISPYSLEEGLNMTLEHEFIYPIDDDIVFYSE